MCKGGENRQDRQTDIQTDIQDRQTEIIELSELCVASFKLESLMYSGLFALLSMKTKINSRHIPLCGTPLDEISNTHFTN